MFGLFFASLLTAVFSQSWAWWDGPRAEAALRAEAAEVGSVWLSGGGATVAYRYPLMSLLQGGEVDEHLFEKA